MFLLAAVVDAVDVAAVVEVPDWLKTGSSAVRVDRVGSTGADLRRIVVGIS